LILIIAYGNSLRQDDGAGLVLGCQLAQLWQGQDMAVRLVEVHQLMPELAAEIAQVDVTMVVFVDTRVVDPASDDLTLQLSAVLQADPSPGLGHHLDPGVLLLYASLLYGHRPPAWLVTVPGVAFDHGEGLSPVSQAALSAAPAMAARILQASVLPLC
jgi:hydrogenase maturation protease